MRRYMRRFDLSIPSSSKSASPGKDVQLIVETELRGARPECGDRVGCPLAGAALPHHRTYGSVYGGSCRPRAG